MNLLLRLFAILALFAAPAAALANERAPLEEAVLQRINFARQNPQAYADQLRTYRTWFKGNILYLPGDRNGVYLEEGVSAVDEAIAFMERQRPLPPLSRAELLGLAARDHAAEQGPKGVIGHGSLDGASPGVRVKRRGGDIYVGENISYGFDDPDEVVRQFIVDDGVADRGHRHALFSTDYRFAGVGCGRHAEYRHMCVVDMSATRDGSPDMAKWGGSGNVQLASVDAGGWTKAAWSADQPTYEAVGAGDDYEVVEIIETIEE